MSPSGQRMGHIPTPKESMAEMGKGKVPLLRPSLSFHHRPGNAQITWVIRWRARPTNVWLDCRFMCSTFRPLRFLWAFATRASASPPD